ncbi:MAG: O-antigen ligase family protein [Oscillospiraceae bacterium]
MYRLQKKHSIDTIFDYLAFFQIFSIPTEPFFPIHFRLFTLTLLSMQVILKRKRTFRNAFLLFAFAFFTLTAASLAYTPKNAQGFDTVKVMLYVYFAAVVITSYLNKRFDKIEKQTSFLMNSFCLGTVLILVYTMLVEKDHIFNGYWRLGKIVFQNDGTFMMLSYCIIVSFIWAIFCAMAKKRKIYFFLILFLTFASILSGTKKTFIVFFMTMLLFILLRYRKHTVKLTMLMLCVIAILIAVYDCLLNITFLYQSLGFRIESYLHSLADSSSSLSASSLERAVMQDYAMEWFKDNPIFGNGVSAFRAKYVLVSGRFLYSHCNYTELLCNNGLIGFTLYYGYMLYLTNKLYILYKKTKCESCMFFTIFMVVLLIIDYGQVSYYRLHYILIVAAASVCVSVSQAKLQQVNTITQERMPDPRLRRESDV